jgi:hypothetical protein
MLTIFNQSFLTYESRKPLKSLCFPHGIATKHHLEHVMGSDAVVPSLKKNLMEMHCSAIVKLQITLKNDNNKQLLRSNTEGYGCKTKHTD